eukprot:CAMPEP_0116132716 /NCGR_PEP_ID=MMETSP0329-20121206/9706_1 /TAXON_ID=697910 /ORGANISM="Pseudo-nitzschia arenysensis, Strain B593" /LENGTH=159 /DNA_ID=CAMNT_0003627269 /DNA_START=143 /DNA_END=622 /DNA_ORIENTATION=-
MTVSKTTIARRPTLRKRRRGERRVRFSAPSELNTGKPFLTAEEIQNTWYSRDEERSFKKDAVKALCDYRRKLQYIPNNNTDILMESVPRGLERHTKERRMHKKELVQLVVLAHQKGFHPDDIALFSQSRSNWNMDLATTQGSIDEIEVRLDGGDNCTFM